MQNPNRYLKTALHNQSTTKDNIESNQLKLLNEIIINSNIETENITSLFNVDRDNECTWENGDYHVTKETFRTNAAQVRSMTE